MRILACADIHLGRKPELAQSGHAAWDSIIQKAIGLAVDVVVLAGDVVEHERTWLSVYGPLLSGLETLKNAGIQVVGVGGNHDWSVFPRLTEESDAIKILGLNGTWESHDIGDVRFIGWSFPSTHEEQSPLSDFDASLVDDSKLSLGLLHADWTQQYSKYAPIDEHALLKTGIPLWMLGHIHRGGRLGTSSAYYCGSPFALDVSETGAHGAYLLETEQGRTWKDPLFIALCPYRYEQCIVDATGIQDMESLRSAVTRSVRAYIDQMPFHGTVAVRLVFTGNLHANLDLQQVFSFEGREMELLFQDEDMEVLLLNRAEDATDLEVDLDQLVKGSGPQALLASMLLDSDALQQLGVSYQRLDTESYNTSGFNLLRQTSLTQEEAVKRGKRAVLQLLRAMESQRREHEA
ncbi:MAG: DNA repair exonuclease [Sphaerochaetaceae bacterium]|nr:DNA repair exonuclease [Sphaerochaetaceae bacterium]